MKTSARGITLIKEFEGLRTEAYQDSVGVWTIGYGHTSAAGAPKVVPGLRISGTEAHQILLRDLGAFEGGVTRLVRRPLKQGQFDALVSFAFNVGLGAFSRSTLLKRLNAGRYDEVPAQLMRWTRAGGRELAGLVRRRRAEAGLWRSLDEGPVIVTAGRAEAPVVEEAPGPEKPAAQSGTWWSIVTSIFAGGGLSLTGVDNPYALAAVAVLLLTLGVVGWMIWSGRISILRGPA